MFFLSLTVARFQFSAASYDFTEDSDSSAFISVVVENPNQIVLNTNVKLFITVEMSSTATRGHKFIY